MIGTITVGNTHRVDRMVDVRTPEQQQVVQGILSSPGFDFACSNPFTQDVVPYVGPFSFLWYTTDGHLHSWYIGKRGRILRAIEGWITNGVYQSKDTKITK